MTIGCPRSALSLLLAVAVFVPDAVSGQSLVGYVASLDGDGAQLLRKDAAARRLRLGENILAGDTITAKSDTKVIVDTRNGLVDPCNPTPAVQPCRLHFPPASGGLPGAEVAGRVAVMLTWFVAQQRNLITRTGDAPSVTLGKGERQSIAIGKRSIRIAWNNGDPPFAVTIDAPGSRKASLETAARDIKLPALEIAEGPGRITIVDAQKRSTVLSIVGVKALPPVSDLSPYAINAEHRTLLELGTLAGTGHGEWSLEAFQETHRLGSGSAAINFERALLSGAKP